MVKMNNKEIEKKWQDYWDSHETFKAVNGGDKKPYYNDDYLYIVRFL